jgi:hypothetical protein
MLQYPYRFTQEQSGKITQEQYLMHDFLPDAPFLYTRWNLSQHCTACEECKARAPSLYKGSVCTSCTVLSASSSKLYLTICFALKLDGTGPQNGSLAAITHKITNFSNVDIVDTPCYVYFEWHMVM